MPKQSIGPWYRASKDGWYLTVDGKKVSLKVKGKKNKREAVKAWHKFMTMPKPLQAPPKPKDEAKVKAVVDAFLADAKARVKPTTWKNYNAFLTHFSGAMGGAKAEALNVVKVTVYANRPEWGQAHRYNLLGAIKTAFKWGEEAGLIGKNPLRAMKRPSMPSRGAKAMIDPADRQRLLEAATPPFRLFLTLMNETGARPSELARLTADDVDFASGVAILTEHKTSHKTGKPRLIFLTPAALAILKAQAVVNPDGPLLLNGKGNAWTQSRLSNAMRRANEKAETSIILYAFRHQYATDALANGVPDATVAALLGHSGTTMLHKHYSHLTSRIHVLKEAANTIRR